MAKISTYASKTTPVDADSVVAIDSAASNATKRFTGTNLKAYLKTYFDTLYLAIASAFATTTEVLTGTNTTKAVTPDALAALWEKGSNVASAGTISLGEGGFFHITGTTTITDIDFATDKNGRWAWLVFDGALTLTHNASTLILPTGGNITTTAGDACLIISEGSDVVKCVYYNGRFANIKTSSNIESGNYFAAGGGYYIGALGATPILDHAGSYVVRWRDATGAAGCPHQYWEMTAPAAPPANCLHLWAQDNGSGKTQLMVRFQSGAAIQLAIEP